MWISHAIRDRGFQPQIACPDTSAESHGRFGCSADLPGVGCLRNAMRVIAALVWVTASSAISVGQGPADIRRINDVVYAEVDGHRLMLDLYLPAAVENPPLIVWIHGGAWRGGSRAKMPLTNLVKSGFAVASIDYRLSPVARFPAQIHDCKAAIRFLRASAVEYGIDAGRIGVTGSSAGGHLAALVGVTNDHPELEGNVGRYLDQSSSVQAIVDYFGPTNFMTILPQSTPHGLSVRVPALQLLLGDSPDAKPDLARMASPVFHVDASDPPLLLIHGDQDPQVPINQSHELQGTYEALSLPVRLEVVHGGVHGGNLFFDTTRNEMVRDFFAEHLGRNR